MGVENLIIGASYSDECHRTPWQQKVKASFAKEQEQGKAFPNHYIVRDTRFLADPVKFLWPLHGVPILTYCYVNALRSSARRVVVVGNSTVGSLVRLLNEEYAQELKGKGTAIWWAHEGSEWSLHNTVKKGMTSLSLGEGHRTGLLCPDTPLFTRLDDLLNDTDNSCDALLDCNGLENMFPGHAAPGPFPRSYHIAIATDKGTVRCKEPNAYIISNKTAVLGMLETAFSARKTGYGGGLGPAFFRACLRKPHKTLPYMLWHESGTLLTLAAEGIRYLTQSTRLEYAPFNWRAACFHQDNLSTLASKALGARLRIKAAHHDPARLLDIDSLEDYAYVATLLEKHPHVYPYQNDINRIRQRVMPRTTSSPVMLFFDSFINAYAEAVGVAPLFENGTHRPLWDVFPQYSQTMIDSCATCLTQPTKKKD